MHLQFAPISTSSPSVRGTSRTVLCPAPRCTGSKIQSPEYWVERRKQRVFDEIMEQAVKSPKTKHIDPAVVAEGIRQLDALLPGWVPNLDVMKGSDYALLASDINACGAKIVTLKSMYPTMDLTLVLTKRPQVLLLDKERIENDAIQVRRMLENSKDIDALVQAVPQLMSPKLCLSILVTVRKWWFLEKDPVEILDNDPDLVARAQAMDQPFDPVYEDENGNFEAPLLNYKEKRTSWQKYIDNTVFNQE